jgi:outer membrane protein assembly factor BamA
MNPPRCVDSPAKQDMFITAGVTEGEQYKIGAVEISGDTILPKDIERLVPTSSEDQVLALLSSLMRSPRPWVNGCVRR